MHSTRTKLAATNIQETGSVTENQAVTETQAIAQTQIVVAQRTAQLVSQKQSLESTKLVVYSSVNKVNSLIEQNAVLTASRSAASPISGISSLLHALTPIPN
jgi:hypothetical protein